MGYKIDKDWLLKNSEAEDNLSVSAGSFDFSMTKAVRPKASKSSSKKTSRRGATANITTRSKKQHKRAS